MNQNVKCCNFNQTSGVSDILRQDVGAVLMKYIRSGLAMLFDLTRAVIGQGEVHGSVGPNSKFGPNTEYRICSGFENEPNTNTE